MDIPDDELRVKQVARELGIPFTSVTRLVRRGALKAKRPGPPGTWRIPRADLDLYIASRNREAAQRDERHNAGGSGPASGSREGTGASAVCEHTGVVGFCGQCDGQWVVQASGVTYVFDLAASMVTVMPGDVDDDDGVPPYPQLFMVTSDLGGMRVRGALEVTVHDPWGEGEDHILSGWISYIARV